MRHYYRFIILSSLFLSSNVFAMKFFIDGLLWRATNSNNWVYVNSLTLPQQTINYKTIDFNYAPGFRVGASFDGGWGTTLAYTRFYTKTNDTASGALQPSFVGSVTAKPTTAYLYSSGQVSQVIDYNIFDYGYGKAFHPVGEWMLQPRVGLMGGWINQSTEASFQGSTSTNESITNNFIGLGPKVGVDTSITIMKYHEIEPTLVASFFASYLVGNWVIKDITNVVPARRISVTGSSMSWGALTLQASMGLGLAYKSFSVNCVYELNDWFNQNQFFDNDTGTHNNDLILQGLTLNVSYNF